MGFNRKYGLEKPKTWIFLLISMYLSVASTVNPFSCSLAHAEPANIPSLLLSLPVEGNPPLVWFEKGRLLYKMQAYREALTAFSRIGKDAAQDITEESLYLRANSLMEIGDYSEAMAVARLIPPNSRFYRYGIYTKAMVSLHTEREDEAIEYLEQISKDFAGESLALKAHLTLGFIFMERKNPEEAIKHLSLIPKDSPFYTQALFGLGWAYASMDRWIRAVVFWEELSYLYPDSRYTREAMPYIGRAYITLSAYGKALEQNGIALRYYKGLLKELPEIEKGVRKKEPGRIAHAIEMIGDRGLSTEFDLYNGLLSMEEYLLKEKGIRGSDIETLTMASTKKRGEIGEDLSEKLGHRIEELRRQLLEASANASLEIARNLRLEGGGEISQDMIFDGQ